MLREFRQIDPFHRRTTQRLRFATFDPGEEKLQCDGLFRISVRHLLKQFAHHNLDAELFVQFADKALLEGFIRFAFATGEFPQPAQVSIRVTLSDEEFARVKDEAGTYFNDG